MTVKASPYAFVPLFLVLAPLIATAQAPLPYSESFDGGGVPAGWTLTATSATVVWDVDAAPTPVGPGPDGATDGGSAGSLNYNDDVDFDDAGIANSGSATSPAIDTSGAGGSITISFRCNYETEDTGTSFDVRTMEVIDASTAAVIATFTFAEFGDSAPPGTTCSPMGTYHTHTLAVAIGAAASVQIRFNFDTIDGVLNTFDGWFVDTLSVTCADAIPPSAPTLLSPPDLSTVPSPPGVPLDWTDATDTSSCGAGAILNYEVEVDTTNPPVAPFVFSATPAVSSVTTAVLPIGVYFWRVRARDTGGNLGAYSTVFSFTVEPPLPPGPPDTLHVNEGPPGAQNGDTGFVDPVIDETPMFSAIYRDPNTTDNAAQIRYQVSQDPLFILIDFDSGPVGLVPLLPKDSRCPDVTVPTDLLRDTIYFWRCQFTDVGGLTGPFSAAQSFRIGDDFEFGVRRGSSHHGRNCFVATAAYGAESHEVSTLKSFRKEVLESAGAGRLFSRWYAANGSAIADAASSTPASRCAVRIGLAPVAWATGSFGGTAALCLGLAMALGLVAWRRS